MHAHARVQSHVLRRVQNVRKHARTPVCALCAKIFCFFCGKISEHAEALSPIEWVPKEVAKDASSQRPCPMSIPLGIPPSGPSAFAVGMRRKTRRDHLCARRATADAHGTRFFFFAAGRKVQVKLSVKTPAFGWGEADHVSVFKVKEVNN